MAGHSKWKQIKRQKAVVDARRGAQFTKLGREITMAAKAGGGDPDGNPRLRLAILKAKEGNMPNDIIDRAITKAVGGADASQLDEIVYEGYGPGGTAVLVEAVTDNRNRTVAEIRNAFTRGGGNLGESGSVAWQFNTRGVVALNLPPSVDSEEVALMAIDAGAEDFTVEEDSLSVYTKPEDLMAVRQALIELGHEPDSAEIDRVPTTMVPLEEKEAIQALKLLERLEDLDDVQKVYSNADFPEEVLAGYEA
ncbi:MAG TPA: YebC/PmpR family DNA-binding transcriptional regulator [Dehalococcoidia bacterium]|jgi:YebC/PmpR family DNA-binding regulatory protein|nr:YebC/PmpR family DNA-binding transcriptional regulator [Dehalococcoidia bacterium]